MYKYYIILMLCIYNIYLAVVNEDEIFYANSFAFIIALLIQNIVIHSNYYGKPVNIDIETLVNAITIIVSILSTAHIFILGFNSKKVFNKPISYYYSSKIKNTVNLYIPTIIFLVCNILFEDNNLNLIALYVLILNLILFISIVDDVLKWNKGIVNTKYSTEIDAAIRNLPVYIDEKEAQSFMDDISRFNYNKEQVLIDILNERIENAIIVPANGEPDLNVDKLDPLSHKLFSCILNSYSSHEKKKLDLSNIQASSHVIFHLLNYQKKNIILSLMLKEKIEIAEISFVNLNSILFNIFIDKIKNSEMFDDHNQMSSLLRSILYAKDEEDGPELIKRYLIALYEVGYDINLFFNASPKNFNDIYITIVVESISDWHQKIAGNTNFRKLPSFLVCDNVQTTYFLLENKGIFYMSVDEILELSSRLLYVYNEVHELLYMEFAQGAYTSKISYSKHLSENIVRWIMCRLNSFNNSDELNIETATNLEEIIEVLTLPGINEANEYENIRKKLNEGIELKLNLVSNFPEKMSKLIQQASYSNGILEEKNRKRINELINTNQGDYFPDENSNKIYERIKVYLNEIDKLEEGKEYITVAVMGGIRYNYVSLFSIYAYICENMNLVMERDAGNILRRKFENNKIFKKALGAEYVKNNSNVKSYVSFDKYQKDRWFLGGFEEALNFFVERDQVEDRVDFIKHFKENNVTDLFWENYEITWKLEGLKIWPTNKNFTVEQFMDILEDEPYILSQLFENCYTDSVTKENSSSAKISFITEMLKQLNDNHSFRIRHIYTIINFFNDEEIKNKDVKKCILNVLKAFKKINRTYTIRSVPEKQIYKDLELLCRAAPELKESFVINVKNIVDKDNKLN